MILLRSFSYLWIYSSVRYVTYISFPQCWLDLFSDGDLNRNIKEAFLQQTSKSVGGVSMRTELGWYKQKLSWVLCNSFSKKSASSCNLYWHFSPTTIRLGIVADVKNDASNHLIVKRNL